MLGGECPWDWMESNRATALRVQAVSLVTATACASANELMPWCGQEPLLCLAGECPEQMCVFPSEARDAGAELSSRVSACVGGSAFAPTLLNPFALCLV